MKGYINISIQLSNDAFQDGNAAYEVARILQDLPLADLFSYMEGGGVGYVEHTLYDINGNGCGRYEIGRGAKR